MNKFYILSLKWSRGSDTLIWWRDKDSGYTSALAEAGQYTQEQVDGHRNYYDNGESTLAVPVELVPQFAVQVVRAERLGGLYSALAVKHMDDAGSEPVDITAKPEGL